VQVQLDSLDEHLPADLPSLENPQTALPAIAKDEKILAAIAESVQQVPTRHDLYLGDGREMRLKPGSVHLVVTSPPYWNLKKGLVD
jgi:hypothetical protein